MKRLWPASRKRATVETRAPNRLVFESLETRFLLSAEAGIPPPDPNELTDLALQDLATPDKPASGGIIAFAVETAPPEGGEVIGTDAADELTSQAGDDTLVGGDGDDIYRFSDGFGADMVIEEADQGSDTLDFSNVTADLEFSIALDGTVVVTDLMNPGNIVTASDVENLIGGSGNDTFVFEDGATLGGAIQGGPGTNTLDLSAYEVPVNIDLGAGSAAADFVSGTAGIVGGGADGTVTGIGEVSGGAFGGSLIGDAADNAFAIAAGDAWDIVGADGSDSLYVDGDGKPLESSSAGMLTFAGASPVSYATLENVTFGNASTSMSAADLEQIYLGLEQLTQRMDELEALAGYASAIPLADPAGATFGELMNFGRVLQTLVDEFEQTFAAGSDADGNPLFTDGHTSRDVVDFLQGFSPNLQAVVTDSAATISSVEDIEGTISWLAGTLDVSDRIVLDAAGAVAEIHFIQRLGSERRSEMDLALSGTLRDAGVALERGSIFAFDSGFTLDFDFGVVTGADPAFFVEDSLALTATAALDGALDDIDADSLIGFMGGSIEAGFLHELTAAADALLQASDQGRWSLDELAGGDVFSVANELSAITALLPFAMDPGFTEDIGSGLIELGGAAFDFLASDLTVTLPTEYSDEFTLITPSELLRMLDQLGEWLNRLTQSEILDLNVPFAGTTTVGDLLAFGDAFGEELLRFLVRHDGLSLAGDALELGRLGAATDTSEVVFALDVETPLGASTYEIVLDVAATSGHGSVEDLSDYIHAQVEESVGTDLASEIEVFYELGRIGFRPSLGATTVLGVALPKIGNESLGFDGNRLTIPRSILDTGVLGHSLEFTLDVDGVAETIHVARDASNGSIDDLVDDINVALSGAGLDGIVAGFSDDSARELIFSTTSSNIGAALLTGVREPTSLVAGAMRLGVEAASFASAQELADQLADILSAFVSGVSVDFDVENKEVSFTVALDRSFNLASIPFDLGVDLGELVTIETSSNLLVTADVSLGFTFGVDLAPEQSLVVAPPIAVPDLPDDDDDYETEDDATFGFTLYQDNFDLAERLSGDLLMVGGFSLDTGVGGSSATQHVTWTPPADGRLVDENGRLQRDQYFFVRVTPPGEDSEFVAGVLLALDTEDNTSPADLAGDLATALTLALRSAPFDLDVEITNADGDGFDIAATGSAGHAISLVTDSEFRIAVVSGVTVEPDGNNTSLDDLLSDVQRAIDKALMDSGREPVYDTLLGLTEATQLNDGGLPVIGEIRVADNGVLDRDVRFVITIGGEEIHGIVDADSTIDNERENENQPDPIEQLAIDVAAAINAALAAAGYSDGPDAVTVSVEAHPPLGATLFTLDAGGSPGQSASHTATSSVPDTGVLDRNIAFTLTTGGGTEITGSLRATATADNESSDDLATDVERALNEALERGGSDAAISVTADGDDRLVFTLEQGDELTVDFSATSAVRLQYSVVGEHIQLAFLSSEVVAELSGLRLSLNAVPVLVQPDAENPALVIGRRIEVDTEPDDSAFEELGLLSAPTPYDGRLSADASFQIKIGTSSGEQTFDIVVAKADTDDNESIDDLIDDINTALRDALGDAEGSERVQARRVALNDTLQSQGGTPVESKGNRIEFFTDPNSGINLLALPALAADPDNAAIRDLGFDTENERSARIQTGEFFLRDAVLEGGLTLSAENLEGSATIGIGPDNGIGFGVEIVDSRGAVFGEVRLELVNPEYDANDPDADPEERTRVSLGTIWDYLGNSQLGLTRLVDADITGGVAIDLDVAPLIPIGTPIDPATVSLDLTLDDWLGSPPALGDSTAPGSIAVNISGLDLDIYDALRNLSFADIVDALQRVVDFLRDLQGVGGEGSALAAILDEPLPLLNQSPTELLVVADRFAVIVDAVIANPTSSLQALESFLEDLLGLPEELVSLSLDFDDGIALRIDLVFTTGVEASYGLDLDLDDLVALTDADSAARTFLDGVASLVGVSSTGDLSVGIDGTVRLSFGIAIGKGNGSAEALGFKDGATSTDGVLTAEGDAQAAADRLAEQDIEFDLVVGDDVFRIVVEASDETKDPLQVDGETKLSELKDAPELVAGAELIVHLRDGRELSIDFGHPDLTDLLGEPTITDVLVLLNAAAPGDLVAVFEPNLQRFLLTDSTTPAAGSQQSGVYVTLTNVTMPNDNTFPAVEFSLRVGNDRAAVPVSVAEVSGITRKEWLARIDEAIRKAMVDAGQLNPVAEPVVDVAYNALINGGQLTFQGTGDGFGARLTIFTEGGVFKVENAEDSEFAEKLGIEKSDEDGDGLILGKELRKDEPADTNGLVGDLQRAIDAALAGSGLPAITVDLLSAESGTGSGGGEGLGRLRLTTSADTALEIRSVTQAVAPFLYNGEQGTALTIAAEAAGDHLEFTAQVGPFGFFVVNGTAALGGQFLVSLEDTGESDGRTYFGSDEFAVATSYGGSATADLPLYFPTESTPVNDDNNSLEIAIPSLAGFFDGTGGSVTIAAPDLTAFPTPTLIGMLSNPEFIIDGLDRVLLNLQDALDGEIYGIELPLIGDGLAPAGQFIADFRADVLSYLSIKLREGGLNPVTLVRETLYNIFGGEDDGDPAAVALLALTPGQQAVGVLTGGTLVSGALERDAELNITVGDDGPVRLVVLADSVEGETADDLVAAVNDALLGRGLDEVLTASWVARSGGFALRLTAANPDDTILVETAGAIPLSLFGAEIGGLDLLRDVASLVDGTGALDGIVDINDVVRSGFGLFDEFGQFDLLLGQRTVFGQALDFDLGVPILEFDLDAGIEVALEWELGFGFGVSQTDGFYFVSDSPLIDEPEELIISVDVGLLGALGFAPGATAVIDAANDRVVLEGTGALPANGRLGGDVGFALDVDGTLVDDILVRANATNDNSDVADLALDIETAIAAAIARVNQSSADPIGVLISVRAELDADGLETGRLLLVADGAGTTLAIFDSAQALGQLGFLALEAVDGGRGRGTPESSADPRLRRYSGVDLRFTVDILDPGADNDRLTFAEISSSSTTLDDLVVASATLNAVANLGFTVNFDAFGLDSAVLPGIGADLFLEWDEVSFDTRTGADIPTPTVEFRDLTLDLGSFLSDFAGPYLEEIGAAIEPLGFLLDRNDGLLYKRLPVISDLAGETITLKRLAELLDREAKIVPFLNALEQLYFLVDLVGEAAASAGDGPIELSFGTITLPNLDSFDTLQDATAEKDKNFNNDPTSEYNRSGDSTPTRQFTRNITKPGPGSISFDILQADTIIDLLLGRPDVSLVTYDLPPFGFEFEYRQRFPIYPPLFATLGGVFTTTIDLAFGYDALGLNQFRGSSNPLDLLNGFFFSDVDAAGVDIPEVTLYGAITAGASLDVAVASAGVEGGLDATIWFDLNDPNLDTKVRFGELAGNLLLNNYNPLAIFDTSGQFDAFLRAYVEVLFGLWSAEYEIARVKLASFEIPFERVPLLGQDLGNGVLQVNLGPASANRLHGSLSDGDQFISARYEAGSVYLSGNDGLPEQRFIGVERIVVDGGAGNDVIDFSAFDNAGIEVEIRGGSGNDTIYGGRNSINLLIGGDGNDTIVGGSRADRIEGGAGNDRIFAGGGDDLILGGDGDDVIEADRSINPNGSTRAVGSGNDDIDGGAGDDVLRGGAGDDIYRFAGDWGQDTVEEETSLTSNPGAGGADSFSFADTGNDVDFMLGQDARIGSVESVVVENGWLRIGSTAHGLSTGDQVELAGLVVAGDGSGGDGNGDESLPEGVDPPGVLSGTVIVEPGERDSFLVMLSDVPPAFDLAAGSAIWQLDRTGLAVESIENANTADDGASGNGDPAADEPLAQIETSRRHGLEDGDLVRIGGRDPATGGLVLHDEWFGITVVNPYTFNLDGVLIDDPRLMLDALFVQREETDAGLIADVVVDDAGGDPALILTSARHGLADGDEIAIFGAGESLNGHYTVALIYQPDSDDPGSDPDLDPDRFRLVPLDGNAPAVPADWATGVWQRSSIAASSLGNTVMHNGFGIETLIGGRGGDLFEVFATAAPTVVLNGLGGSDTYVGHAPNPRVAAGLESNVRIADDGNLWDTDVSVYLGSQGDDRLAVDNTRILTAADLAAAAVDPAASESRGFFYAEPNVVLGFESGTSGAGTIASSVLHSGALERAAEFLLRRDSDDPVLIVVEPDAVDGDDADALVDAIKAALGDSDLAGLVTVRAESLTEPSTGFRLVFYALAAGTDPDGEPPQADPARRLSIENVSPGSGIERLEIEARGGDDVIAIGSTNERTAVTVRGGLGDDRIAVGGPGLAPAGPGAMGAAGGAGPFPDDFAVDPTAGITLNDIRGGALTGALIIDGDEGHNTLYLSDATDSSDNTGRLSERTISGLGMQIDIDYAGIHSLILQLGLGDDHFTIERTTGDTTELRAGAGSDRVTIERADGALAVDGESGDDRLLLESSRPSSTVALSGGVGSDWIGVQTMDGSVNIAGGDGDDRIEVGTRPDAPGTLNSINGALSISGGAGADALSIDDTTDGGSTLLGHRPLSERAADLGRLGADAAFTLIFDDGHTAEIVVNAEPGVLGAVAAAPLDGRLSADAFLVLSIDGGAGVEIRLEADPENLSREDLLDDLNAALELAGLDPERVSAALDPATGELRLVSHRGETLDIDIEDGNTAATELGFVSGTSAVFDNSTVEDLLADINAALVAAGIGDRVAAGIDSARQTLALELLSGESMLVRLDPDGASATDLGLADAQLLQIGNTGVLEIDVQSGRARLTGLGLGTDTAAAAITYDTVSRVSIALGAGADTFQVRGTLDDEPNEGGSITTLATGGGDDSIFVSDPVAAGGDPLDGTLDRIRGALEILAGDGSNALRISDRASLLGDTGVIIAAERIDGLAPAPILYQTTGRFAGGIEIWAGRGDDSVTVSSVRAGDVTRFHANDGDDRIVVSDRDAAVPDGLLAISGDAGRDRIDAAGWTTGIIVFGDRGELVFDGSERSPGTLSAVAVIDAAAGADDEIEGSSGDDLLFGGAGSDSVSGGAGSDVVIGDGGRVSYAADGRVQVEATALFTGAGDRIAGGRMDDAARHGGDGNDILIGGAGSDLLFGTLAEDVMIFEYGRITLHNGRAESVVVLGQRPLDLAASEMFELYLAPPLVSPFGSDEVGSTPAAVRVDRAPVPDVDILVSTGNTSTDPRSDLSRGSSLVDPSAVDPSVEPPTALPTIRFALDSADLSAAARESLSAAAAWLRAWPDARLQVGGFTDASGEAAYNLNLSLQRARAVREFLIGEGIEPSRLQVCAYGEVEPLDENGEPNRRVVLELEADCPSPEASRRDGDPGSQAGGERASAPRIAAASGAEDSAEGAAAAPLVLGSLAAIGLAGWRGTSAAPSRPGRARLIDWLRNADPGARQPREADASAARDGLDGGGP